MVLQQYILSTTYDPQHEVMSIHLMKDESLIRDLIINAISTAYEDVILKSWLLDLIVAPTIVGGLYRRGIEIQHYYKR